jgi:hypothetical protein
MAALRGERGEAPVSQIAAGQEPAAKTTTSPEPRTDASVSGTRPVKLRAHGRVVDAAGRPVAGASVYIREWAILRTMGTSADESDKRLRGGEIADILARTATDKDGRFRFENVVAPPFRHAPVAGKGYYPWDLVAIAPGHVVAWTRLTNANQRTEIALKLPVEGLLRGRLHDIQGKPIAGARIKVFAVYPLGYLNPRLHDDPAHLDLTWSSIPLLAMTGADGTFTLGGLPREVQTCLVITEPHHERKVTYAATTSRPQPEVSGNPGQPRIERDRVYTEDFTLILKSTDHRLVGRAVLETTGRPAARTEVRLNHRGKLTADADGKFLLENLPAGEIELRLVAPMMDAAPVDAKAGDRVDVPSFRLRRGKPVAIVVRDPDGRPVPGAEVASVAFGPDLPAARTDPAGRCEMYGLDPESGFTLDVTHPARRLGGRVAVRPDDSANAKPDGTLEVKLEPCGSLAGRVLDVGGRPMTFAVARLWVVVEYPASGRQIAPRTIDVQEDGTFDCDRLIAGVSYRINNLGDDHATWLGDSIKVRPGAVQDLGEIKLPWADQQVRGVVVDARGRGIGGATVGYERDPRPDKINPPMGCHWFQQTDAHGRFRLSGLPRGTIKLLAYRRVEGNHSVLQKIHVQARAGATDVRIVLPDVDDRLQGIE